jgi:hypothetical protein
VVVELSLVLLLHNLLVDQAEHKDQELLHNKDQAVRYLGFKDHVKDSQKHPLLKQLHLRLHV